MTREPDPNETKTKVIAEYVLLAVKDLGEQARWTAIIDRAEQLGEVDMTQADRRLMCKDADGRHEIYAPDGYTGRTWKVWRGKADRALGELFRDGFLARSEARIYTFTDKGRDYLTAIETCQKYRRTRPSEA